MKIEIDQLEARTMLTLVRKAETDAGGPITRGNPSGDVNAVYLGLLHGIVTKLDDAYIRSARIT
jgi:hypothetical protein